MNIQKRGLMLLVVLLALAMFVSAENGCYVYENGAEDLYCFSNLKESVAKQDCDTHSDCTFEEDFKPSQDCSVFPECKTVTCSTDCTEKALGQCTNDGGTEVAADQYQALCAPGCCVFKAEGGNECNFGISKSSCEGLASKKGVTSDFYSAAIYDAKACKLECGQPLAEGTLEGLVQDTTNKPIPNAKIEISGQTPVISDAEGKYTTKLAPGTYSLSISADKFQIETATVEILPEKTKTFDITLKPAIATAKVTGKVESKTEKIKDAIISWKGTVAGTTKSDENGEYTIALPPGKYTITAQKENFAIKTQEIEVTTEHELNFVLETADKTVISGTTFVESKPTYGVKIYIDGVLKTTSQFEDNIYTVTLFAKEKEEHTIYASYEGFAFGPTKFSIDPLEAKELDLILTKVSTECNLNIQKAVEVFSVTPVLGKPHALLSWKSPCPEVASYEITRGPDTKVFTLPADTNSLIDEELEWGDKLYTYSIKAVYIDAGTKKHSEATTREITTGDVFCENKHNENTGWEEFCQKSDTASVFTCNNQNKVTGLKCPASSYCAPTEPGKASCKKVDMCLNGGGPFGLTFTKEQCYGENNENFCYYDYTNTIADQCSSCLSVESCFSYKSKDACQTNACVTDNCKWIDSASNIEVIDYSLIFKEYNKDSLFTTPETGSGYCVQEDYKGDDTCSLCSSGATIFENNYCTADVCSNLGRCFSDTQLTSCNSCGELPKADTTCFSYLTEQECTSITTTPFGVTTPSQDSCGWGTCFWTGSNCVKDSDVNKKSDCQNFNAAEAELCGIDNTPPLTTISSKDVFVISNKFQNMTFTGDDSGGETPKAGQNNPVGKFGYCLTDGAQDTCTLDKFTEVSFPQKQPASSVTVNLFKQITQPVKGNGYQLKYYSKDIYSNKEEIQSYFVYVDNVLPEFTIKEQETTTGDSTDLTVFLEGLNEPMSCVYDLEPTLPKAAVIKQDTARDKNKNVNFNGLKGIRYNISVTCTDDYGNSNIRSKTYVFDKDKAIQITSPKKKDVLSITEFGFTVTTSIDSSCELFDTQTNEKIAEFTAESSQKSHKTQSLAGFKEGNYPARYKVICQDITTQEKFENYFDFSIDFTAPPTKIILTEGSREETPVNFGWEQNFIKKTDVRFECVKDGFECDQTFYCLGPGCELKTSKNYLTFEAGFELNLSTQICYYSNDKSGNEQIQPTCGTVFFDGYGIILENPTHYTYKSQIWGVSNKPVFDLTFSTKVPASICKFAQQSGFDYDNVEPARILQNTNGKFIYKNFPTGVLKEYPTNGGVKKLYVICENSGEKSPEHLINIEYDPTPPEIDSAKADPSKVLEGTKTSLLVETDDKTLCKYSDNSDATGSVHFKTMPFTFGDTELEEDHKDIYSFNFLGLKKSFNMNVQCMNGAGDKSGVKNIKFDVDYSAVGNIIKAEPQGKFLRGRNVSLFLETSKTASCQYRPGEEYLPFTSAGRTHTATLGNLQDKHHIVPVRCVMGDHTVEATLSFTIDNVPPQITRVEDGNYSCGSPTWDIMVESNEGNMSGYYYEVYDKGVQKEKTYESSFFSGFSYSSLNTTDKTKQDGIVLNGSVGEALPFSIPTTTLTENHTYNVRTWAWDKAGNKGGPKDSDGIKINPKNSPVCTAKTSSPKITILTNDSSCTETIASIKCTDDLGCKDLKYGKHTSPTLCKPTLFYKGGGMSIRTTTTICYTGKDYAGNNISGTYQVQFNDKDSDRVRDSCDKCPNSLSGFTAGTNGCSSTEIPQDNLKDTDGDGLPDKWEKQQDRQGCPLNYASKDSDGNGINDGDEDYDKDGTSTWSEYLSKSDPCVADKITPTIKPPKKPTPSTSSEEESNLLPLILLISGLVLVVGGSGYLTYLYLYSPDFKAGKTKPSSFTPTTQRTSKQQKQTGIFDPFLTWKKKRQSKQKRAKASSLFGMFSKNPISHIEKTLGGSASHHEKIAKAAQAYVEHKDEITPQHGEKSIFAKLESIAGQSKSKDIKKIVTKKQAKDIFSKLKDITKKRKK
jgi:hypothetical protein